MFPTFSESNETTYRPTNEDCLMRQVTTPNFCSVCKEGLWMSLLGGVSLIDDIEDYCIGSDKVLNLTVVPLAQLRDTPVPGLVESLGIRWLKDGQEMADWTNKTVVQMEGQKVLGEWAVEIQYSTEEIRKDTQGLTKDSLKFEVDQGC